MKIHLPPPPFYKEKPRYKITYIKNVGWVFKKYHPSDIRQELIKWGYEF